MKTRNEIFHTWGLLPGCFKHLCYWPHSWRHWIGDSSRQLATHSTHSKYVSCVLCCTEARLPNMVVLQKRQKGTHVCLVQVGKVVMRCYFPIPPPWHAIRKRYISQMVTLRSTFVSPTVSCFTTVCCTEYNGIEWNVKPLVPMDFCHTCAPWLYFSVLKVSHFRPHYCMLFHWCCKFSVKTIWGFIRAQLKIKI